MATPFDFNLVRQAALTNGPPNRELDEVVSPAELIRRRYEILCRLSGALASGTPEDWIRHLRADLHSDSACVFLPGPDVAELELYAFDFPLRSKTFLKRSPIPFENTLADPKVQSGNLLEGT